MYVLVELMNDERIISINKLKKRKIINLLNDNINIKSDYIDILIKKLLEANKICGLKITDNCIPLSYKLLSFN